MLEVQRDTIKKMPGVFEKPAPTDGRGASKLITSALEEEWPAAKVLTKPSLPQDLIQATVAVCRAVTPS
jgi:hypothetical protein